MKRQQKSRKNRHLRRWNNAPAHRRGGRRIDEGLPDTVREWVRSGRLRASKLAGSKTLRISTDDIMAFYDANETHA